MSQLLANFQTKFFGATRLSSALCMLGLSLISNTALAQDGLPNTSFGSNGNGRTQIPAQPYVTDKNAMLVLPDGRIVVAGRRPNSNELVMYMYNTDGTPTASFGPGTVIGNFAGVVGLPKLAFDAQRDGILLAADYEENGTRLIMVCRILRNGAPDSSLSTTTSVPGCNFRVAPPSAPNGLSVIGVSKSRSGPEAIYVTGSALNFSVMDYSQTFFYTLFPTLQISWHVEATTPGTSNIYNYNGLSETDDAQRLFLVGGGSSQTDSWSVVQAIQSTPAAFGNRSVFNPNFLPQGFDTAHAVAFTSAARNRIVVVGEAQRTAAGASDCTLTEYDISGSNATTRDLNFGGTGIGYVRSNFTSLFNDSAQCTAISVDGQGRIYVSGVLALANGPGSYFDVDILVARFSPTGVLDTTYGPNGQGYVLLDNGFDDPIFGAFGFDAAVGLGLTANGAVVASKRSPMTGANVQNTTWWLNGLSGTAVVSELLFKNGFE